MQPKFYFKHAELFISVIEKSSNDGFKLNGNLLRSTNPLMLFVLITDLIMKLKLQFRSLALRIDFVYA